MRKRIPLNAVRAFEAVARHTSVVKAADELCVTPTAVSHQIKVLEEFLQTNLFERRSCRMYPTASATSGLSKISCALDLIDDAVFEMGTVSEDTDRSLLVNTSSSLGSLWLMPRIRGFMDQEPDIELHVSTFISRREADTQRCDIRICNWQGQPDYQAEALVEEAIVPVCAPQLAARYDNYREDVLRTAPLLHVDRLQTCYDGTLVDWARYLAETGVSRADTQRGPRFNQAATAIEAARVGVGILLGRALLIEGAMARGELVAIGPPFPVRCRYYMQTPINTQHSPQLGRFKDWLMDTVSAGNPQWEAQPRVN